MSFEQARFNMIEQQIRPWSVLDDTVLQTMNSIPRDLFVPDSLNSLAYADIEIPLGHDENMMFPRIEGRMLQELEIGIDDECLEIGTGSAYVTACMANMAKSVHSIDIYDDFLQQAKEKLARINISNVRLQKYDIFSDFGAGKKYDAIAVTGSISEYMPLFEQLLKPGGRLFIVVGANKVAHATKVKRIDDSFIRTALFETELRLLKGSPVKLNFKF